MDAMKAPWEHHEPTTDEPWTDERSIMGTPRECHGATMDPPRRHQRDIMTIS